MRKAPAVADSPFDDVTIQYPPTEETRVVNRGAVGGFTNSGWVVLDAAGRKKAQQPTASKEN